MANRKGSLLCEKVTLHWEVAMSVRIVLAIATAAIFVFTLDVGLSVHHLSAAKAANAYVVQIHRDYPGALDTHRPCPAAAETWCQAAGGLAE